MCSHSRSTAQSYKPLLTCALVPKILLLAWLLKAHQGFPLSGSVTCSFLTALLAVSCFLVCPPDLQVPSSPWVLLQLTFGHSQSLHAEWSSLREVTGAGWDPGPASQTCFALTLRDLHPLLVFLSHTLAGPLPRAFLCQQLTYFTTS